MYITNTNKKDLLIDIFIFIDVLSVSVHNSLVHVIFIYNVLS